MANENKNENKNEDVVAKHDYRDTEEEIGVNPFKLLSKTVTEDQIDIVKAMDIGGEQSSVIMKTTVKSPSGVSVSLLEIQYCKLLETATEDGNVLYSIRKLS